MSASAPQQARAEQGLPGVGGHVWLSARPDLCLRAILANGSKGHLKHLLHNTLEAVFNRKEKKEKRRKKKKKKETKWHGVPYPLASKLSDSIVLVDAKLCKRCADNANRT